MNEAAHYFADEVALLANRHGQVVRFEDDGSWEVFIPSPRGELELGGSKEWASVAWGYLLIEDARILTSQDADLLLAICDAILAGDANSDRKASSATLTTRGFTSVWKCA
ncbi:hypothetical protein [Brevundimonas sp.]|uniref:hypothetical protein n=1 Tax=Brevundimonas sp. TaxID=1871086 RepID=UPI0035B43BFA